MSDAPVQPDATPRPAPALGAAVLRGSAWMLVSTTVSRVLSLASTVVLGWLLDEHAWGLYGLAISAAGLAGVARDGGARQILLQRQNEYEQLVGPCYWFATAINLAAALLLAAAAPLVGWYSGEPQAVAMIIIVAASIPLSTPGLLLEAKLQIDMRFKAAGLVLAASSMMRFGGAIALACFGIGAKSFVIPLVGCAMIEWAITRWLTRERLWTRPAHVRRWPHLASSAGWIILGGFGIVLGNLGPNLVIKPFVSTEVVGLYFFAFQIVVQVGIVAGTNINAVLFSALSKLVGEPARFAAAALRSLRPAMTLGTVLSMGLGVTFPALSALIWKDKWDDSVTAVLLQGLAFPFSVALAVPLAVQQSRGHFRHWSLGLIALAFFTLLGAALGAYLHGSPAGIAAWSGGLGALARIGYTALGLRRIGVRVLDTLAAIMPVWIVGVACALFAFWVDLSLASPRFTIPLLPGAWQGHAWNAMRFTIVGFAFSGAMAFFFRLFLREHTLETLAMLPLRVRRLGQTVLRVRDRAP